MAPSQSQDNSTAALVGRLARESIRPYVGWIVAALLCMLLVAAATGASAWLMEPVINKVFVEKNKALLWPIGGAILITFLIKGLANYGQAVLMSFVGQRIITDTQHRLYAHLTGMELGFFHDSPTGNLISRFTIDINMMRAAVSNALTGVGKDFLSLIFLIGVMFYQDWVLALISVFIFPAAVLPIVRLGRRIRKVTINTQEEMGQFTTLLEQTFQGARVVKAYGMEEYEKGRVRNIAERVFGLVFKAARIRSLASPIMETLGGVAVCLVVLYGGFRVIDQSMDPGSFFSFITALLLAYEPMKRLANLNAALQEGLAGAQRLFQLLDREPVIKDAPEARPLAIGRGEIALDHVRFAYTPEQPALDGISLTAPAGKMTALVGPSGAGKSTILNLIPRFYDVDAGSLAIDGIDIRTCTLDSLRSGMALVSQEIVLFDDTIRANIAYGRMGADEDAITAAAKGAAAHEFIIELPDGYETYVGERGVKLSGGQRQRLAIARAMLRDAPILLLDEATSALDTESERQIQAALERLTRDRTTLVIAHRLSTVIDADIIHVINRGRLEESGSHAELLAKGGIYARLYALQFADDNQPKAAAVAGVAGAGE
ncbi:MAG: ABC transporter transmembrane domain-containing protein [Rhodospirillales bacterium]|nr:ABC transporter transmembrane domain-containing protein [Rhodospirillales bacterium]